MPLERQRQEHLPGAKPGVERGAGFPDRLRIRKISNNAGHRVGKGEHCHRNFGGIGETCFILKSPTDLRHGGIVCLREIWWLSMGTERQTGRRVPPALV